MLYQLILLQFIAHLLGDFVSQPHGWTVKKSSKILTWYHVWHALLIFFFLFLYHLILDF